MPLTYRQMLDVLLGMPSYKLEDTATVYTPDGEFYPIHHVAKSNDNSVLDDGHLYLSADEILFENDQDVQS